MSEVNPVFLDTNIWLYSFLKSDETTEKKKIADSLISQDGVVVSTQVINEVCVNLIKKASFEEGEIQELIEDFYHRCLAGRGDTRQTGHDVNFCKDPPFGVDLNFA